MNEPKTLLDRIYTRIRNNPVLAILIVLGTIIIALSTFTDAAKNLVRMVMPETRPDVNGEWKAEVSYDWNNAKYTEIFTLNGDGAEVHGTASFLGTKKGILEGKLGKDKIEFITKTYEYIWKTQGLSASQERRLAINRYRGIISRDKIKFVMQTEGGYSEHIPIEFTAKRVPNTALNRTR